MFSRTLVTLGRASQSAWTARVRHAVTIPPFVRGYARLTGNPAANAFAFVLTVQLSGPPSSSASSKIRRTPTQSIQTTPTAESTQFADPQQSEQAVYEPPPPSVAESVFLPAETPEDVIKQTGDGPAYVIQHPGLMVGRQIEMMNVLVGYEQANKYAVTDHNGVNVGFICEEEVSFAGNILRQILGTRRVFNAVVLDVHGNVVLKINRPFKWFLNSTITISDANDTVIGEVKQVWHPLRRKYDLFLKHKQFAIIEAGFLAWDFVIEGEHPGEVLAAVNRNFAGFAREIFTDTGVYAIHMDNLEEKTRPLSLDERAVILGCAITIDIDYFSRHSDHGSGMLPFLFLGAFSS
ncbi:hypothetical protein HDU81_009105 [Chytriomyces hyalinus]|nr:hypothetical protein HDU81_009105 [Chytriomyces hyalinus]